MYVWFFFFFDKLQIPFWEKEKFVAVIYMEKTLFDKKEHFNKIKLKNKKCYIVKNDRFYEVESNRMVSFDFLKNKFSHFIFFEKDIAIDFEKVFYHYSYLDSHIGVKFIKNGDLSFFNYKYRIISDDMNSDIVFSIDLLEDLYNNFNMKTEKYII